MASAHTLIYANEVYHSMWSHDISVGGARAFAEGCKNTSIENPTLFPWS